jgi:hypothetical protein
MLRAVSIIAGLIASVALVALCIFWFSDQHGLYGYASVLIYCALGLIVLSGMLFAGSTGPRHPQDEYLHRATSTEETHEIDRNTREEGLSAGLILFLVASYPALLAMHSPSYPVNDSNDNTLTGMHVS